MMLIHFVGLTWRTVTTSYRFPKIRSAGKGEWIERDLIPHPTLYGRTLYAVSILSSLYSIWADPLCCKNTVPAMLHVCYKYIQP